MEEQLPMPSKTIDMKRLNRLFNRKSAKKNKEEKVETPNKK